LKSDISSVTTSSTRAVAERRRGLRSLTLPELVDWTDRRGFDSYRASQLAGWFYNRPLTAVDEMHNLPLDLRQALAEDFDVTLPERADCRESSDGTRKLLVGLADGARVESVLIPRGERLTLCLSTQVGCGMGCTFCATARMGLMRNLEPHEIIGQVLLAREVAGSQPVTNYVFMGMGEPLANYERLLAAIGLMTARWGLGVSPRRITVSTVGLVPALQRLVTDTSVNVAVSLNATRDELRDDIMPVNRRYPIAELLEACRQLDLPRRKRVTFEYVMLAGVNDSDEDADRLVSLFASMAVKLNLIPFNPFEGSEFEPPSPERVDAFQRRMLDRGLHTTVRISRGRDIAAACGQLAAAGS